MPTSTWPACPLNDTQLSLGRKLAPEGGQRYPMMPPPPPPFQRERHTIELCSISGFIDMLDNMRLDKWLWAARFFKTRSLAAQEITKGRVHVNQQLAKPARDIKPGDMLWIKRGDAGVTVTVMALSSVRGPAPVAQQLYAETPDSIAAREKAAEMRRLAPEPSHQLEQGRPTKRDRRLIDRLRGSHG